MKTIEPIGMSEDQFFEMNESCGGLCIECRDVAFQVEPDARYYRCDGCGAYAVFGVEELLIRGVITFTHFGKST